MEIVHLNFGWLHAPPFPPACCHCLMIRSKSNVILIDSGIGLKDIESPEERVGVEAIEAAGFQFRSEMTASEQLRGMGIEPENVSDIVLTHCDPDHIGGLADFPNAKVHLSAEEKKNFDSGNPRYRSSQFSHDPNLILYGENDCQFFDLAARKVNVDLEVDIRLVPLFGHTLGHCGVAINCNDHWHFHIGDAYYLKVELESGDHPVSQLAEHSSDDNELRVQSLDKLRSLVKQEISHLSMFGYHDTAELPSYIPEFHPA